VEIIRDITALKALEKEREEFVSMLTHDMKTPLTAVVGSVELVRDGRLGPLKPEQKEYLESATESCEEIVELIDNLLDVYRFESGKMVLAYTKEDIGSLIIKSASSFRSLAERSEITLNVNLPESLPQFMLDRTKVVRLFGNLLSNAFKFTPEGGEVAISAEKVEDCTDILASITSGTYIEEIRPVEGPAIVVRVSDTGCGIPPESLVDIFDKFVQARQRREGKTRGTGLGLAFCRKVMDAHGGYIWVESRQGNGSRFTVLFPMLEKASSGPAGL
jgi:signal transduction histidine kinase